MTERIERVRGSFRDHAGFVFTRDDRVLRQVHRACVAEFEDVAGAGLHDDLITSGLLIPHEVAPLADRFTADAGVVLEVPRVPFVSYPYEWCFSQLKDAALLTLDIQRRALKRGFTLRDASAYNIQFVAGRPLFIDTLSLGRWAAGTPWVGYRQFCEHFLAPLALMSRRDIRCGQLLRTNLDGIPLDLGSRLLPFSSRLRPHLLLHIVLHAKSIRAFAGSSVETVSRGATISLRALLALIDGLQRAIESLHWSPSGSEWGDYIDNTNYSAAARASKHRQVCEVLEHLSPRTVWDLGSNTGEYSREAARSAAFVAAFDADPAAVELHYRSVRAAREARVLPLLLDLRNPSGPNGWAAAERDSLADRGPADVVLALALIHHLAIGNNVPLTRVAAFFASLGRALVVEFVPKTDSQVQRLLRNRPDAFPGYTQVEFESAFETCFTIDRRTTVVDSVRSLYVMRSRLLP